MKKALIIGAGPAGISASLYISRSNCCKATVISNGQSALAKADMIENYFGFAEPVSGQVLLENGRKNAQRLGAEFIDGELIELQLTADMKFSAVFSAGKQDIFDTVLIATGASRKTPDITGLKSFEGKGISYCAVCDAFFYRGKPTAVIGSGEYAAHEAETLSGTSSSVTIVTNGEELTASLPENIICITDKIKEISGDGKVERIVFENDKEIDISGIFIAVGTAGSTDIARKTGAVIDENKIIVDENMQTNVPGLFAAGDCTGGLLQVSKAVSDGAIAGLGMIRFIKSKK